MFKRILTGVIAFCFLLVPVVFFADTVVLPIAVALFGVVATYEVLHCVGLHKNLWVSAPLYLVSAALPFGIRYFAIGRREFPDYGIVGPMYDGNDYKGYNVHNRFETQTMYNALST